MTQIFYSFLLTSALGTVLALIISIIRPATRKVLSAEWHYYIWLAVLIVMILPVRLNLPQNITESNQYTDIVTIEASKSEFHKIATVAQTNIEHLTKNKLAQNNLSPIKEFLSNNALLISYIWLAVAIALFIIKIAGYAIFLNKAKKYSEPVFCEDINLYTSRNIKTRVSDTISSPLAIGIIKPTVILPKADITREQLHHILAHEITHIKRNDILYKWFLNIVKCVHWYNPAIYLISRQINNYCEISCDLSVVKQMDEQAKKKYAETILLLLSHNNSKAIPLTTGMTGDKSLLKKRFILIKQKHKVNKASHIISVIISVIFLFATIFTGGVMANDILGIENNIFDTRIEVLDNNHLIQLSNKPFYKDDTVYLPLQELLETTGMLSLNNCKLVKSGNIITIYIAECDNIPSTNQKGSNPTVLNYCYEIEIGKAQYIINPKGSPLYKSDNPIYKEHLNKKVKMKNTPIISNNIVYIPYEYVDFMINKVTKNHKITYQNDTNNIPQESIENAENMTYEDIRSLQISVNNGHFPWRLDAKQVILSYLSGKGKNVSTIRMTDFSGDKLKYTDGNMEIELFKPIDKTENGIWVVKSYKENQTASFVWPCERTAISKGFETRVHPITGEKRVHNGIDISAPEGTPVFSSISGSVADTGFDTKYGNYIIIENDSTSTYYGHLSAIEVKKGENILQKATIGKVGKTGTATGSFLHFEIKINGVYYDPLEIFKEHKIDSNVKEIEKSADDVKNSSIKIKSTEISDAPYAGFEHLTIKNASISRLEQELNKNGFDITNKSTVNLNSNYIVKDYALEHTTVMPDKNGNISIYFSSNSDNLFDVHFYNAQSGENVASYGVLANNENAYTFIGFENDKAYNVEVVSKTKNDWLIEGEYIIY